MGIDIKEIILSWYDSFTDDEKKRPGQLELAQKRYEICLGCEHFRPNRFFKNDSYCNDCNCPLNKKIYSRKYNACQLNKWQEIDENATDILDKPKGSKTLL